MNTCMHCGFTGEPEEFRYPTGSICKNCHKKQQKKRNERHYNDNKEEILKQKRKNYENNKEEINKRNKEYRKNNREQKLAQRGEYRKNNREKLAEKDRIRRRKAGILPWTEIKSLRLGLYIEQTIARMFGSVAEVTNNPGVDFICPNGYKIQVKAASTTYNRGNPQWSFRIKNNKTVDYFILVAVNHIEDIDKEDFKPEHIWMMKGNVLNRKAGTSITPSRISKWNKYSIIKEYENKFVACCTMMKRNKPEVIKK